MTRAHTRWFLAVALSFAPPLACPGAPESTPFDLRLPHFGADLSGELALPDAPVARWQIHGRHAPPQSTVAHLDLSADGEGLAVAGRLELDPSTRNGEWSIRDGSVDLSLWFRPLATHFRALEEWRGYDLSGKLRLAGNGSLNAGKPEGHCALELADVDIANTAQGLSIKGLNLRLEALDLAARTSPAGQTFTFREAEFAGARASEGEISFALLGQDRIQLERASLKVFGGSVTVEPMVFTAGPNGVDQIEATVNVARLGLDEIAALLPEVVTEARGRVSGRIGVRWNRKDGFTPGEGRLRIDRLIEAEIRLAARPGFLTERVPPRIQLLPDWLGPLSKMWLSFDNPAYNVLREIELGRMSLKVETLQMQVNPEGDRAGRTAHVRVTARPEGSKDVELLTFDINVSGPLEQVLKLRGADQISIRKSP